MPIVKTGQNITVGPVAILCATVAALGTMATFIIIAIYAPTGIDLLRPLASTLSTAVGVALLWWRTAKSQAQHSQENAVIIEKTDTAADKADTAADKAEIAAETVDKRLNGDLDRRIAEGVKIALDEYNKTQS